MSDLTVPPELSARLAALAKEGGPNATLAEAFLASLEAQAEARGAAKVRSQWGAALLSAGFAVLMTVAGAAWTKAQESAIAQDRLTRLEIAVDRNTLSAIPTLDRESRARSEALADRLRALESALGEVRTDTSWIRSTLERGR